MPGPNKLTVVSLGCRQIVWENGNGDEPGELGNARWVCLMQLSDGRLFGRLSGGFDGIPPYSIESLNKVVHRWSEKFWTQWKQLEIPQERAGTPSHGAGSPENSAASPCKPPQVVPEDDQTPTNIP
jgi:hypothetical protein